MTSTRTLTGMLPSDVTALLGDTHDVITAIVRAEKYGHGRVRGADCTVTHDGYQHGATSFNAATALYKVRY